MTKEEIKTLLYDKLNSCYIAKNDYYPNTIFFYYDINFIRSKKLANILNKDVEYPKEVKGLLIIEINIEKEIYLCHDDNIFEELNKHYSNNWDPFMLISKWIKEFYINCSKKFHV